MGKTIAPVVAAVCVFAASPAASWAESPAAEYMAEYVDYTDLERGPVVTMEIADSALGEVLRTLGAKHRINVIVEGEVAGRVSISVSGVPLWDALDPVLMRAGYERRVFPGGIHVIGPMDEAVKKERYSAVREFRLRYADVSAGLLESVRTVLTERGRATAPDGTQTVVVKDVRLGIERASALLAAIDSAPSQVMIEARIVEIGAAYAREMGVEWGAEHDYSGGDVFGGLGEIASSMGVSLPSSSTGGATLGLGVVSSDVDIDLALSALEQTGKARVILRPSVLVSENREATIADGVELVMPSAQASTVILNKTGAGDTTSASSSGIDTFSALLALNVTPRVVDPLHVSLQVDMRREAFDFSTEVEGFPPKYTRSARTSIVVKNGETLVIGGIMSDDSQSQDDGVPLLGRIPFLGRLFRHESKEEEKTELLIFVTPTIAKEAI